MDVEHFTASLRRGARPHHIALVRAGRGDRVRVEVTESPNGRSVQVHINGRKVWPEVES